jgi:dihydrofolate reductase
MRKIIAGLNMTLDGFCDHTAGIADDEIHEHYNEVLRNAGTLIYGRTTYQLMESYWPTLVANPSGNKAEDDFAVLMDNIDKIVYSRTLTSVDWKNSTLRSEIKPDEIEALKQQPGKDIYVGSPSMIVQFTNLGLIDEYRLLVHPVILGKGLTLFRNIQEKVDLKLTNTKTFTNGVVGLYYDASLPRR